MINLLCTLVRLYGILVLIRALLSWVPGFQAEKAEKVLAKITEPVLSPVRKFMVNHLPQKWLRLDFSPIVVWLAADILSIIISSLLGGII